MSRSDANVLGFAGYSGAGKTTLLKQIIPLLKEHGLRGANQKKPSRF